MGSLMETNCKATSGYLNLPLRPLEEVIAERFKDGSGLGGDETPTPPPEGLGQSPNDGAKDPDPR